jgi:hypothetical protein
MTSLYGSLGIKRSVRAHEFVSCIVCHDHSPFEGFSLPLMITRIGVIKTARLKIAL